jgi:16S rRNA (uracil1498-N3)-methyltransferase
MPRFFSDVQGPTALITGKDVNHITGPLRKQIGDELLIRDAGQGFRARITSISKADVSLDIIERQELEDRGSRQLHLAVSIIDLKDMDDLMRLVSELGVASIHPVIAERSNIRDNQEWIDGRILSGNRSSRPSGNRFLLLRPL